MNRGRSNGQMSGRNVAQTVFGLKGRFRQPRPKAWEQRHCGQFALKGNAEKDFLL
jgi:hypothetical protein